MEKTWKSIMNCSACVANLYLCFGRDLIQVQLHVHHRICQIYLKVAVMSVMKHLEKEHSFELISIQRYLYSIFYNLNCF